MNASALNTVADAFAFNVMMGALCHKPLCFVNRDFTFKTTVKIAKILYSGGCCTKAASFLCRIKPGQL